MSVFGGWSLVISLKECANAKMLPMELFNKGITALHYLPVAQSFNLTTNSKHVRLNNLKTINFCINGIQLYSLYTSDFSSFAIPSTIPHPVITGFSSKWYWCVSLFTSPYETWKMDSLIIFVMQQELPRHDVNSSVYIFCH